MKRVMVLKEKKMERRISVMIYFKSKKKRFRMSPKKGI